MSPRFSALMTVVLTMAVIPTRAIAQDVQAQLWDASITGDTAAISAALAAGADIDSLDVRRNPNGRRALNWAAFNNRGPAVSLLIAKGASLNAVNRTGFTPIHHAAEAGATEALRILLASGADVTIPNGKGMLPIDTAREQGNDDAVQVLEAAQKKP
jgi:ankyrin repeat protein